jgi:hypothetical protein
MVNPAAGSIIGRLPRLFALQAMALGSQERHGGKAQRKSQENAADKNNDNHGVTSLPLREISACKGWLVVQIKFAPLINPLNSLG